ncbi:hypothetical protein B0H14DRAFT_2618457 [Mycena olivaceomarginata]|nr:hypothetical protein B0H14DRAFT_2618457 [Mycena olivaceomarginata]
MYKSHGSDCSPNDDFRDFFTGWAKIENFEWLDSATVLGRSGNKSALIPFGTPQERTIAVLKGYGTGTGHGTLEGATYSSGNQNERARFPPNSPKAKKRSRRNQPPHRPSTQIKITARVGTGRAANSVEVFYIFSRVEFMPETEVHEVGYQNYHSPPPSYEQALIEDSNEGELDADLAAAKAFIQILEWRTLMQPCVRASWDDQTKHEIDRVAQEITWHLERGIAAVESCPGVAEVLESIELETPAMANPSLYKLFGVVCGPEDREPPTPTLCEITK